MKKNRIIVVDRGARPSWKFIENEFGLFFCKQRGITYRLFWEPLSDAKPCWIGRLKAGGSAYYTVEDSIGATRVRFPHGSFVFRNQNDDTPEPSHSKKK
jgi:hypothetical protein